jgi:hypothetical protein
LLYISATSNLAGSVKRIGTAAWKIRLIEEMNPEWKDLPRRLSIV